MQLQLVPKNISLHSYMLLEKYHIVNSYGLFRKMTGIGGRTELVIQGSMDGEDWKDYEFHYKPGNINEICSIIMPH
jgi:hypothetical protein